MKVTFRLPPGGLQESRKIYFETEGCNALIVELSQTRVDVRGHARMDRRRCERRAGVYRHGASLGTRWPELLDSSQCCAIHWATGLLLPRRRQ